MAAVAGIAGAGNERQSSNTIQRGLVFRTQLVGNKVNIKTMEGVA